MRRYFSGTLFQLKNVSLTVSAPLNKISSRDEFTLIMNCHLCLENLPVPLALYPHNGRYGTRDISPNQNPQGKPSDVHLAPGPYGRPQGSYHFSGRFTSYIEIPNNGGLDTRHSITVLVWMKYRNRGPIFNYGLTTWGFHIWIVGGGNFYARSPNWNAGYSVEPPLSKSWQYVGVSYDFPSGVMRLWVNGETAYQV